MLSTHTELGAVPAPTARPEDEEVSRENTGWGAACLWGIHSRLGTAPAAPTHLESSAQPWPSSVVRASACAPRGHWFGSPSRPRPRL